jgi:hypothetical protein
MSLLAATQFTAIATAILAAGAMVTSVFAYLAFRKQSAEVGLLQRQAARDSEQRRRDQAAHVFAWAEQRPYDDDPGDMRAAACLRNTSRQPVYNIRLGRGTTGEQTKLVLLPGEDHVILGAGSRVADGTSLVWAEFRDAHDVRWRTDSVGELKELPTRS